MQPTRPSRNTKRGP